METPRLRLRELQESDIPQFNRMNADPQVMEYFLKKLTESESEDLYERMGMETQEYGYGVYGVERKEDNAFIGFVGFHHISFDVDFAPGVEILWRMQKEYWNEGYATEAAATCLEYAKENLPFKMVWSFTSLLNTRSQRVMQKIGMELVKTFSHPDVPEGHPLKEHVLYKIDL